MGTTGQRRGRVAAATSATRGAPGRAARLPWLSWALALMDTNPPGWGSRICSPRRVRESVGRAWGAWGDRRGARGVCGVGGASSASCAWGQRCLRRLWEPPEPPCATQHTPKPHQHPSQHRAGATRGVPFLAVVPGNGKTGANPGAPQASLRI